MFNLERKSKMLLAAGLVFVTLVMTYDLYMNLQLRFSTHPPYYPEPPEDSQPRLVDFYIRYAPGGRWDATMTMRFLNDRDERSLAVWFADKQIFKLK